MAQNVYDDEEFFAAYSRLRRSQHGLAGAAEWPMVRGLLPPLEGQRIIDLGCGFGAFCRWAAQEGAASVLGLDISRRMLARARADTEDSRISYRREDLDTVEIPERAFDLAHSSLALHYVRDLERLVAQIHRGLLPGGRLVLSVEHPIFTAPTEPGFTTGGEGDARWPVDHYLVEGERTTSWLTPGVVKYHRTIATYVNLLHETGFDLEQLVEWGPDETQIAEFPEWRIELHRPPFLLIAARCRADA